MKEKKTVGQEIMDWWHENKKIVKTGLICGTVGILYGAVKGAQANNALWLEHGFTPAQDDVEVPCDDLELTNENCDDPELLEAVK